MRLGRVFLLAFMILSLASASIYFILQQTAITNAQASLRTLHERIENDLAVSQGRLDTTLYNADPTTPHPHGSGGFTTPLYIITRDGFVIERSQPIPGLLDSADFKHLLGFNEPQLIAHVTNDRWRVLSREVKNAKGTVIGVVSVAYHNPPEQLMDTIDDRLRSAVDNIHANISVTGNEMDVENVDIRKVPYDIAFEIVSQYNSVLLNNGRMPTFIDPSYVEQEFKRTNARRIITHPQSRTRYLISSQPIEKNAQKLGVIVVGHSLQETDRLLHTYLIFSFLINLFILSPLFMLLYRHFAGKYFETAAHQDKKLPTRLRFDAKQSIVHADERKIVIPYATNQYVLCKAIFSSPKKRWELDELVKKIGETEEGDTWRTIYDAALALNKKVGFRLVDYKDKTFRLHPDLQAVVF